MFSYSLVNLSELFNRIHGIRQYDIGICQPYSSVKGPFYSMDGDAVTFGL